MVQSFTMNRPSHNAAHACLASHREQLLLAINWLCLLVVGPVVCAVVVETLCLSHVAELFDGFFLGNVAVYLVIHLVLYLICRNTRVSCSIALVLVVLVGVANHFVTVFTGVPLTFGDLMSAGVGLAVAGGYAYSFDDDLLRCLVIVVVYAGILVAVPRSSIRVGFRHHRGAYALVLVGAVAVAGALGASSLWDRIDTHEWNPAYPYTHYGFALSFISDAASASSLEAEGYDASSLWSLDDETGIVRVNIGGGFLYDADEAPHYTSVSTSSPNIIVIMDESFSDLATYLDGYETSEDAMPCLRSLMARDDVVSGTCAVSSDPGTGTANSEFEFLTGNSMAFFKGSTPYVQYIEAETPSLASLLKGRGYDTLAMHAYEKVGYNRVRVYDRLGFDEYHGIEDFTVPIECARDYPTDETNYRQLIHEFEAHEGSAPQFIFNVTMQNHGGYYATDYEWPTRITEAAPVVSEDDSVVTYESSVRMADDALEGLIAYFEQVDEPTVILFFGDHEPRLSNEFYGSWYEDENDIDLDLTADLHKTPFVLWSNYSGFAGSSFENGEVVSLNYLAAVMMEACGMELSPYQECLLELHQEHPVVTARYFTDADGVKTGTTPVSISDALRQYQWLQYNSVFDAANRIPGFYA